MVAIAWAVSFNAKLVIMDEPTSSLDEAEVAVLLKTVRQLQSDGVAVIFASHKLNELYEVCDHVTVMRDGHTVSVANMADMSKLQLVAAMLGRDLAEVRASGATAFTAGEGNIGKVLLEAKNLGAGSKVHDVSLTVRSGEIVALAGLLGSGRTETARTLFAANPPSSGEINYCDSTTHFASPRDAIAAGMGFCSEERKLDGIIPDMSVADNLTLALAPALSRSGILDEKKQREIVLRYIKDIGWELFAIASVVVGGTLLTGGQGSIGGTLTGALLLGLIYTILNFENGLGWISLSAYWQSVVRGLFLLSVVIIQSRFTKLGKLQ